MRDANSDYNLDLLNPFRFQGDGYIEVSYDCNSRKKPQVIVYVTDLVVIIAFEESLLSDDKVMALSVVSRSLADAVSSMKMLGRTCEDCIAEMSK